MIVVADEEAASVHADLMMAVKREPARLRIKFRDERALMSRVASVERDDARRVAAFPRTLPGFNASARGRHRDNLTRCEGKGKSRAQQHLRVRRVRDVADRARWESAISYHMLRSNGRVPPRVVSFRQKNSFVKSAYCRFPAS